MPMSSPQITRMFGFWFVGAAKSLPSLPCCRSSLLPLEREDLPPVAGHAHDQPAVLPRVVERLLGALVVSVLALRVVVVHQELERGASAALRVLEHLDVSVRVPGGEDGPAADVDLDADGLADFVVDEADPRLADERGAGVDDLALVLEGGAHHLLGRNPIDRGRDLAHEVDPPARD